MNIRLLMALKKERVQIVVLGIERKNCDSKLNLQILISLPETRGESPGKRSADEHSLSERSQSSQPRSVLSGSVQGSAGLFIRKLYL